MKGLKKGDIIYTSILACICIVIVAAVWIFGDKIFFKEKKENEGNKEITVYKTEKEYINTDFSDLVKDGMLNIADCGAVPNSTYDYGDMFRSAIKTCLDTGAKLVLNEGVYYCSPAQNSEFLFDYSGFSADGFQIEGNGATIINTDNFSGFFKFAESKDIAISGINFDYFFVPWVQAEVAFYDKDSNTITLLTEGSRCVFDDPRYMNNQADIFGVIRDKDNPRLIDNERLSCFNISSIKKIEENGYEVSLGAETVSSGIKFDIGDKVTISNRKEAKYSVFDIRTSENVTLTDLTAYSANGCFVLGQYMTGDVILKNVNILYGNNEGRLITTNSDGVRIQSGRGKLIMNNCRFEGLSGDGVNLYQESALVKEIVSNDTFILDGRATETRVVQNKGETLVFFDASKGKLLGEAKVTEVEEVEGHPALFVRKVTVEQEIQGIITGSDRAVATQVYIKDQELPDSEITNCTFNNIMGEPLSQAMLPEEQP